MERLVGGERKIMKWLMALVLPFLIPMAEVAAQGTSAVTLATPPLLGGALPVPQPQPQPQTIRDDGVRDTWELGLGYAYVGFRSSQFNATMSGLNSTVSYYLRDHFAVEGSVTSAFGSQSSSSASAKYLFYGAGVKLSAGRRKLQPFVHALVGGVHVFPQTANSDNGFAVQLGAGAERRMWQRIWLRVEGDYMRSQLYGSGQNNFQAIAAVNYRF
jgi:opacity protein-like surface antigen